MGLYFGAVGWCWIGWGGWLFGVLGRGCGALCGVFYALVPCVKCCGVCLYGLGGGLPVHL